MLCLFPKWVDYAIPTTRLAEPKHANAEEFDWQVIFLAGNLAWKKARWGNVDAD